MSSIPQVHHGAENAENDVRRQHQGSHAAVAPGEIAVGVVIGRASEYFDFFTYGIASVLVFPAVFFPFLSRVDGVLLAFAAMALWPRAHALATDIDPVSIEVTLENAEANPVNRDRLALAVAEGVDHPLYRQLAPFDLVIANILARPLIELAPSIAATIEQGGTLILAGLLDTQAKAVASAYRREGMRLADTIRNGDWTILMMRKRRQVR